MDPHRLHCGFAHRTIRATFVEMAKLGEQFNNDAPLNAAADMQKICCPMLADASTKITLIVRAAAKHSIEKFVALFVPLIRSQNEISFHSILRTTRVYIVDGMRDSKRMQLEEYRFVGCFNHGTWWMMAKGKRRGGKSDRFAASAIFVMNTRVAAVVDDAFTFKHFQHVDFFHSIRSLRNVSTSRDSCRRGDAECAHV